MPDYLHDCISNLNWVVDHHSVRFNMIHAHILLVGVDIANDEHSSYQLQSSLYTQYTGISFEPHVLLRKDELKITGELGQGIIIKHQYMISINYNNYLLGAFGIVYKGCIQPTGTDVAIKTLKGKCMISK